jgi:uncharacterized protein (DUF1778 family)
MLLAAKGTEVVTMRSSETNKTQEVRLDFRLTSDVKATIEKAAAASGQSVTDFAVSTLYERAKKVLEEESVRRLSNRDRDIFLQMLDDTNRKPNVALRRAAARYKRTVNARRRRTSVA